MATKKVAKKTDKTDGKQKRKGDHLFKKGQSGNPKGRPKGSFSLTTLMKQRLEQLTNEGRPIGEMLADNIIQDALDSSDAMRKLIWNYVDGLPKQPVEVDGEVTIKTELSDEQLERIIRKRAKGLTSKESSEGAV